MIKGYIVKIELLETVSLIGRILLKEPETIHFKEMILAESEDEAKNLLLKSSDVSQYMSKKYVLESCTAREMSEDETINYLF